MTIDKKCLINWVGGERLLRKVIAPLIPTDIKSYIEPFGGKGSTFGCVKKSSGGACKSLKNYNLKIDAIHERLDRVLIENRDFEKLIKQYDFESAFFYCDPPYTFGAGYEVTSTTDFDHEQRYSEKHRRDFRLLNRRKL
jgi:site-specific DNA-adenine methylase